MYNIVNHKLGGIVLDAFKKFLTKTLYPACLVFTAIVFLSSLLFELTEQPSLYAANLLGLIQFFVFSLILCWSNIVFEDEKMSFVGAHFLHYFIFLFNVVVSFIFIGQRGNLFGTLVAFSFLYLVGALIALIVRKIVKKTHPKKKDIQYKKQFK